MNKEIKIVEKCIKDLGSITHHYCMNNICFTNKANLAELMKDLKKLLKALEEK
jgi:hypothetical protein